MGDGQLPQCATQTEGCVSGGKTKQALILMLISHDTAMVSCHDRPKLWVRRNSSSLKLLLPGILPSEKTNDEKTHIPYKRMLQQWRGAKCACLDAANVDELKKHYIKGREGGSANNCCLCKHKDLNSDPKNPQEKNAVHQVCGIGVHSGGRRILGFGGHTVYMRMIVNIYENYLQSDGRSWIIEMVAQHC